MGVVEMIGSGYTVASTPAQGGHVPTDAQESAAHRPPPSRRKR